MANSRNLVSFYLREKVFLYEYTVVAKYLGHSKPPKKSFQIINFGARARPPKGVERVPKYWNCVDPKTTFFTLKSQPKYQIQRALA
jgi:hypothetical protein